MKSAWLKWGIVLLLVVLSGWYASGITLREDALDLLPDTIRETDLSLFQSLGMVDRVYLSLSLDSALDPVTDDQWEILKKSAITIGSLLEQSTLLTNVVYRLPPGHETSILSELWPYLPVLTDQNDYKKLAATVSQKGIREHLTHNFLLLNSPAGVVLKEQIQRDPLGLSLFILNKLQQIRGEFAVTLVDGLFADKDRRNCLIIADSSMALTNSDKAREVQRSITTLLEQGLEPGITARIIGTLPHTLSNVETVTRDLRFLLPTATMLLIGFLLFVFREARAFFVVFIPFLAAPPAIGVLRLFYPQAGALAMGFGIVLTGLAVDFAVHIYLAMKNENEETREVLTRLRLPIFMALCTTGGVFIVLLFSSVASHRQMALFALAGIVLAVIISWILVPTIVPKKKSLKTTQVQHPFPQTHRRRISLIIWLLLLIAGTMCWSRITFNGDMRVLDATTKQIRDDEAHFFATWRQSSEQAFVLATGDNLDQALTENDRVYHNLGQKIAGQFQSVAPLLPGPETRKKRIAAWQNFWDTQRDTVDIHIARIGNELGFTDQAFTPFLDYITASPAPPAAEKLLNGTLQPLFSSLVHGNKKSESNKDSGYTIMTIVPEDDTTWPVLRETEEISPRIHLLSLKKWRVKAEQLMKKDFARLALAAGLLIFLLTAVFFRNIIKIMAALAPVCAALSGMTIFTFLAHQDINMMHVLMGIMVIGLSVDYGIFTVCAHEGGMIHTTRKAVFVCAISSCIGFGVLAFARHPALHALGTTVLVGIGVALPASLWVTPAFLAFGKKRR